MIKYYINYNKETNKKLGFYNTEVYKFEDIPTPNFEINEDEWIKELNENNTHFNPQTKEFYTVTEEIKKDVSEQLEILKNSFQNDKNDLINEYNNLKTQAELKFDDELAEELKEDFSEDLQELEKNYLKDLEELKNGN